MRPYTLPLSPWRQLLACSSRCSRHFFPCSTIMHRDHRGTDMFLIPLRFPWDDSIWPIFLWWVEHGWSTLSHQVGLGDYAPVTTAWQKLSAILFIWLSIILLAVLFGFISAEAESELLGDEATPRLGASRSRRVRPAALLIGLHVLSAVVLMSTESWSLMDSMYFTTVVLTTVGYGDMSPKTDMGRTVTSFLVLAGVPCTAALVHRLSGRFSSRLVREIQKLDEWVGPQVATP